MHVRIPALLLLLAACANEHTSTGQPTDGGMTPTDSGSRGDSARPADDAASASDAGSEGDAGPNDAGVQPPPRFEPAFFDLNHILSTGQSLSVGTAGAPALSKTQPHDNKMFVTGVRAGGSGLTSLVPLVEAGSETMSTGMATLITSLAETDTLAGEPPPKNTHRLLVSCHGIGGTAYVGLKKGTAAFSNGMAQVTAGQTLSKAAGMTYVVRAVTNVHGESDHTSKNTQYEQNLVEWQKDYETDVTAITGQKVPIPMLHTQMSSWTKYGQATSVIPAAQLTASVKSNGKIVMVGPKYFLAYAPDGVHLSNAGYRRMGEYYAKAYRRVVLEGKAWEPLRPKTITRTANVIRVVFQVPSPPLAFDTTLVSAIANQGFEYTDASGTPPKITKVSLDGANAVKIELEAAPTAGGQRLRYAYTGVARAAAGPTSGPRGNLRDSDVTPSENNEPLYNWAVHFDEPIP